MTTLYSIKDLEKLSGIKGHTLRIWEKRYNIIKPGRTTTNIRNYTDEDLKQVLNISLLNRHGFKISAIAKMSVTERQDQLAAITMPDDGLDAIQANLLLSLLELNEAMFNQVFTTMVNKLGFEKAFVIVVFPFFERIGLMWQAGTINPAQEHFFSNLIRQKLITETAGLAVPQNVKAKKVLLFLPENELHELGLLFYNFAFRSRGYQTVYLGQSVPLAGIGKVVGICKPDYVVTGLTSLLNTVSFERFLKQVSESIKNVKIIYTGPVPQSYTSILPYGFLTIKDLLSLLNIS